MTESIALTADAFLVPRRADHTPAIFAAVEHNREHLRPWLDWVDHCRCVEDIVARQRHAEQLHERGELDEYVVVRGGRVAGKIDLHTISHADASARIGYWLTLEAQGHGLATTAVKHVTRLAFERHAVERIDIWTRRDNVRSQAVALRAGYRPLSPDSAGPSPIETAFCMTREDWRNAAATGSHQWDDLLEPHVLVGERVRLEPLMERHATEMYAILRDPQIWAFTDSDAPTSVHALSLRYRRLETRRSPDHTEGWLNWAIRAESDLVGFFQATVLSDGLIRIAYALGRSFWGKGYATDAARTVITYLADRIPDATFEAVVDDRNEASLNLLRRLGFNVVDASDPKNLRLRRSNSRCFVALRENPDRSIG